jgi:adenylyltransferase/sulfurtransferase
MTMLTPTVTMQPDYSRQIQLKEVGAAGQAKLAASRVLIVGAGGLGSPVLQNLAGAGVGLLGIIDADILHESNLHRQPIFALSEVGGTKAALAAAAAAKINPEVRIEAH